MDIPDKAWIPLGAITATLIAGLISFVNVLIAKDEKITAFRQEWINSVRVEIARMVAFASTISSLRHVIDAKQEKANSRDDALIEMGAVLKTQTMQFNECRNRVRLYLNPIENKELVKNIESLHSASKISSDVDHQQLKELCENVLAETAAILKTEWIRVKRGERSYVIMKRVVLFACIGLVAVAMVMSRNY